MKLVLGIHTTFTLVEFLPIVSTMGVEFDI